jgi:hypothetical protein
MRARGKIGVAALLGALILAFAAQTASAKTYARFAGPSQFMPPALFIGAHTTIESITWQAWERSSATGAGTLIFNDCTPSCAEGKTTPVAATIALNGRSKCGKRHIFKTLRFSFVRPTDGQPETVKVPKYCPKK